MTTLILLALLCLACLILYAGLDELKPGDRGPGA